MNKEKSKKREVTIHVGNGSPMVTQRVDRNSKCRCGSGKKTKNCCGVTTKFFYTKKTESEKPINNETHE